MTESCHDTANFQLYTRLQPKVIYYDYREKYCMQNWFINIYHHSIKIAVSLLVRAGGTVAAEDQGEAVLTAPDDDHFRVRGLCEPFGRLDALPL